MKKSLKTVLSLILTAAMLLTVMLPAFAATGKAADDKVHLDFEKIENGPDALRKGKAASSGLTQMLPVGDVRVSIVLDGQSTLEKGFSAKGIAANGQAMSYRARLLNQQNALADKISKEVLNGKKLDVKWNLTLAANIISAVVPSIAIEKISRLSGVKKVVIERQYEPAVASVGETVDPNMATSTKMTGAAQTWANGYTGLGSKVAIIDTGIDTDHKSFDADAFEYAVEDSGKEVDLLTADEVAALYDYLNISAVVPAYGYAYESSKIPFAVNYVDGDLDVTHDNDREGEHGSHVAGITAANRFIKEADGTYSNAIEAVQTQGAAPDAQILVMKVFGKGGGAYDSDYMAAIEDAVVLGADAINLSLGSANPGFATDDTYQDILDNFQNYDAVVSISAGNAGTWADASTYGVLWGEDNNFDTVGSPGSFTNALTVASVDNDGSTGPYIVADGRIIFFTETFDNAYHNKSFSSVAGDRDFVYIDAVGRSEEFAAVADLLEGKIGICNRGDTSFFEKANAAVENGAIATVVANNQAGTIAMNLTGYLYTAPAISITQADGAYLKSIAAASGTCDVTYYDEEADANFDETITYYVGSFSVSSDALIQYADEVDYHTMSSFSSFGVPGDLSLKPEITAPGGNIYSVNGLVPGGQAYENMSGTSMAAPQITGLTALVAQYIRENGLADKTGLTVRQLAQSLLMSTAEPLTDSYGYYYPVFQQGAGLANADSAINAKSYVMMADNWAYAADGKVKAELGDDPDREGVYEVGFSLNNFSDEDVEYKLSGDFFTENLQYYYGLYYYDNTTRYIGADIEWTVNGQPVDASAIADYDFNDDGEVNASDVRCLLDVIAGNEEAIPANEDAADYDEDGDVDTYDAYQILSEINSTVILAPAGGKVDIVAKITLDPDDIGSYDLNGNYVEGYLYAQEVISSEGAYGVAHSIPVLGFYGGWTESSMTDIGSVLEWEYDLMDRYPYVLVNGEEDPTVQGFLVKHAGESGAYYLDGNPVLYDDYYLPERNSFNSNDSLDSITTTLIRNAAGSRFFVTNEDDEVIYEELGGPVYSAFYYTNQGAWYYTSNSIKTKYSPAEFEEGDTVTFNLSYAPEYYVQDDGSIDWDALGDGATISYSAVIDNTAPELNDVFYTGYDPETGVWDELTFTAQDNRYIAAIAVFNDAGELLDVIPADLDAEEGEEMDCSFTYDYLYENSLFGTDRLLIQVYDYAGNVTNYKINFDIDDLSSDIEVYMADEATVIMNSTITLETTVYPWGVDESLIWSSSDESIATVDQNGVVTGVAEGECVITATSAIAPFAKAECLVTVTRIEKTLNGVVWDEEGRQWFSEIDVAKLPEYTKLTEDYIGATITSVAYGPYGYLFASDDEGEIYIVDEETLELIDIGNLGVELSDIAASANLGDGILMAVYDTYVLLIDLNTGDIGAFDYSDDLGGATFVGIAAFESTMNTYYNVPIDVYFLLDSDGFLYETAFIKFENDPEVPDGTYDFGLDIVGIFGYSTDSYHYNSLYFDGQSIFWARFNNNAADIICEYDIFGLDIVANLGSFAEDVWPGAALFEFGVNPISFDFEAETAKAPAFVSASVKDAAVPMSSGSIAMPAAGSLNAAVLNADVPVLRAPAADDAFTQTMDLTVEKQSTNGLITVEYDASKVALGTVRSSAPYYTYNDDAENGIITFAYVTTEDAAFAAGDIVATLTFVTSEADDVVYTVTTKEINDEHPENDSEDVTVTNDDHVYGDPTWSWQKTETGYEVTATFTCKAHASCEEKTVTSVAEVTETGETALSCTQDQTVTYTASVEEFGKTYTDTRTDVIAEKTGHNYEDSTEEASWTVRAYTGKKCSVCGDIIDADYTGDTKLHTVMTAANEWAADKGLDAFITGSDTNGEDNTAVIALNVDGIWADVDLAADAFDGFMTAFGAAVKQYFGTDDVTIDGQAVYTNGKFQNTAVKNALFGIGAGFFYKIANLGDDGVYGVYNVTINGEAIELTVKFTGSEENLAKIKSFAGTISEHISAEVVDGNLVIDLIAPEKLVATIAAEYQGAKSVAEALKGVTIGGGLNILASKSADSVFGSQVSAVNKLCAFLCKLSPLANKVIEKITDATVTLADGNNAALIDYVFDPYDASYEDFMSAAIAMLDDGLLARTVGEFTEKDGVYTIPVNVSVDMSNLGLMAGNTISETVIFNLHLFDNCKHPETVELKGYAATCTEDGLTDGCYCRICGKDVVAQEVIPAAHDLVFYPATVSCTKDGNIEYYECSVCGKYFADENAETELTAAQLVAEKLGHDWDDGEVLQEPTCVSGGVMLYTCKNDPNHTKTEYIPANGHTMYEVPGEAPTCTEEGIITFYYCLVCGSFFKDADGADEILSDDEFLIPATGHDMTRTEAVEPTCTEDGNVEYYTCANCGKIFADEEGETELTETAIPAIGHKMTKTEAKAATCEADGNVEFYTCANCGKRFADAEGQTELDNVVIPATGHDWDDGTVLYPATCTEKGLMMIVCKNDASHVRFLALDSLGHNFKDAEDPATWTVNGRTYQKCANEGCDEVINEKKTDTKLHTVMTAANNWAADKGLDAFITGADTNGEDNTAVIALNVDGIWADVDLAADAFDGFMTAFGAAVKQYFGTDDVTIDGQAVYVNGKFQNTAVKNALFGIGAGFFYKIANLGADGVYGVYDVTINGEAIELTVKFTGSEANLAKIKSFAGTISEHISAEVVEGNLVIDVIAPDKLIATVAAEYQGEKTVAEALKGVTVGGGLNILAAKGADSVFGSQVSAVNKLCAFLCKMSPLANKVIEKITEATVTLADGTDADLIDGIFDPYDASYEDFLSAAIAMLDDGLLARTVGEFTEEDGVYTIPVNVSVDMSNLGLMAGNTISETVIFNLHLFDNCAHPETVEVKGYAATCTEDGLTDGSYCRICGEDVVAQEAIPALGHDFDDSIEANVTVVDATCTEAGSKTVKCSRCDETEVTEIPATGHTEEAIAAVAATCTEAGSTAGTKCSVCGTLLTAPETVPALGHDFDDTIKENVTEIAATCTEAGSKTVKCSRCSETEVTEIPAIGHKMTKTAAKAATCENEGNVEFYSCANCGKRFADEEGKTELDDIVIPAIGHDWDDGTVLYPATCTGKGLMMFTCKNDTSHIRLLALDAIGHSYRFDSFVWSEDGASAQAKYVCTNDAEHALYYDAAITSVKTDATCEADAYTVYTATYEGQTAENTVTDKDSALGHDYDESVAANVTVVDATCTAAGSKTVKCSRCDEKQVTEIAAKGHTMTKTAAKAATCTEDGNVEYYTCSVCGKTFADEKGASELTDTVVKAEGHKLVKTELKPATCTEAGNAEYWTCSVCGKVFADEKGTTEIKDTAVPAEGHKLEKVEAVDATEEKEGNIAYYKCANCGKIYADAEGKTELAPEDVVIPKLEGIRKGDVDLNKELTANDARGALRIAVKLDKFTAESKEFRAADVDDSDTVTAEDARSILRVAVKLDDPAWAAWTKTA